MRIATLLILILATPNLFAQNLATKLEDLNIRHTTKNYVLAGTVADGRLRHYGQALEFIHREYSQGFKTLLREREQQLRKDRAARRGRLQPESEQESKEGLQGETERFRVIIFANDRDYQQFGRRHMQGSTEHTGGMYIPSLQLLLILDKGNDNDTMGTLFHEAFHQFIARYMDNPPMWLNEGLATYYGTATANRGRLRFNNPRRDYWKIVRELIQAKDAIPLDEVLGASYQEFYSLAPHPVDDFRDVRRKSVYYAESYTLIHMMVNDAQGRKLLQNYIRDLAEGMSQQDANRKHFPPKRINAIAEGWIKYVRSNPENKG